MSKNNDIIKILIIVFGVLIIGFGVFMIIYFSTAKNKIRSLTMNADFSDTELGIGSEYTFSVTADPEKASLKKVECVCDNPDATFEMDDEGMATLTTGSSEGTVTLYVEYKDIKSNVLTYQIVDLAAREAEEAAAAEEAAKAEQEAAAAEAAAAEAEAAAAASKTYCKMTGDNVNIRSSNSTDSDVLGKAKKGDMFEKVETVDDWTHIMYNGQDAYIKSEYLTDITEEEYNGGASDSSDTGDTKKEETKTETTADTAAAEAAAADTAAADAAAAAAQAQADALAAAQAAAAANPYAGLTAISCKDGTCYVTAAQLQKIHATWDFAGDAIEMAGHHNIGELEQVVGTTVH